MSIPQPINVTLFKKVLGKKKEIVFADIIKDLEMKSTWIRVGPKSNDKPLYKKKE